MSEDGRRPLIVYYIANGHSVSNQNKDRVVGFLGDEDREAATGTPDRLSLIAVSKIPTSSVVIYEIGRAHVCTPVTNAHLVCRLLLEKKNTYNIIYYYLQHFK